MYIVFDMATDREITRHGTPEEAARMAAAFNDADGREGTLREGGNYGWRAAA